MNDATATITRAPQHLRALARANEVRLARAQLKRRIADGVVGVAEVALTCPWEAAGMTIGELLVSQRGWGVTRCRRLLGEVGMTETKTVGSMTERQRRALASNLTLLLVSGPRETATGSGARQCSCPTVQPRSCSASRSPSPAGWATSAPRD